MVIIFYEGYLLYRNMTSEQVSDIPGDSGIKSGSNTIIIARAKDSMNQGELLDASKAELVEVPAELVPKGAITSFTKLSNMRLKQKIAEKEFLNDMDLMPETTAYEDGDRLIEHNFAEGAVPAAVAVGSVIDIKLFVKGGEDPVIISKVVVVSRSNNLLSFYMNRKEQEFLKEAATEGTLFSVLYLDDSQLASEVTYVPSFDMGKE
ncbi:MAG TPA: SAF domain-containing protein [Clostridia bacterium]|nr:SAF domain-containing protein [Clostridia bacterium]